MVVPDARPIESERECVDSLREWVRRGVDESRGVVRVGGAGAETAAINGAVAEAGAGAAEVPVDDASKGFVFKLGMRPERGATADSNIAGATPRNTAEPEPVTAVDDETTVDGFDDVDKVETEAISADTVEKEDETGVEERADVGFVEEVNDDVPAERCEPLVWEGTEAGVVCDGGGVGAATVVGAGGTGGGGRMLVTFPRKVGVFCES